ncbi:MAG: flippase [candidate division WOR-3 bacterium]|nr:flippase [candidate division WOR-3 bacterium]
MVRKSIIARNVLLNILGHILPLLIGICVLPYIIKSLGSERFGLLSIVWVILTYLMIFDFGLGRSTTKYAAEALGREELEIIPGLVWTSVSFQLIIGIIVGFVTFMLNPLFTQNALNIPDKLIPEARTTFYIISLSIPLLIISSPFRGVLEALQRFDLVNIVIILSGTSQFLLPLFGCLFHLTLPGIVLLLIISRLAILLILFFFNITIFPDIKKKRKVNFNLLPRLFAFGWWITVGNLIGPIIRYFDRFVIGSIINIGAVTYYTAPFDIVERLWIIPSSLIMTLFPAFSEIAVKGEKYELKNLYTRALKYLSLITGPILFIFLILSSDILRIWLGSTFAQKSSTVFQIFLFTSIFAILAPIPGSLLQGIGRPDIVTKLYMFELIPNLLGAYFFVRWWGITGAAIIFAIRSTIETLLLFYYASREIGFSPEIYLEDNFLKSLIIFIALGVFFFGLVRLTNIFSIKILISIIFLFSSFLLIWFWLLKPEEKNTVFVTLSSIFKSQ